MEFIVRKQVLPRFIDTEAASQWMKRLSFLAIIRPHGQLGTSWIFGGSTCSDLIHCEQIGCVKQIMRVGRSQEDAPRTEMHAERLKCICIWVYTAKLLTTLAY